MSYYLWINILSISIPFIAGFDKRLQFYQNWKSLFPAILITMVVFIPWDIFKTYLGVWGFNNNYVMGIYFINLPIEELLFFVSIPYACVFTYHAVSLIKKVNQFNGVAKNISFILGILLVILSGLYTDKTYTLVTFLFTGSFLIAHRFLLNSDYLARFYVSFLLILLPFFIVDGALTGMFTPEAVVWYNDSENLGIRIGTIPIEDFVYGLFLLLMNVTLYEIFQRLYRKNI